MYHYLYRISNIVENKHYYGKRSSKIEPQKDLGKKYFSSSCDEVFLADQRTNSHNYRYKIVAVFDTKEKAIYREIRLHKKFNVKNNPKFYNKSNQSSNGFDTTGKFIAKDKEGNIFLADKNDPRRKTGDIQSVMSGKSHVKDKYGKTYHLFSNDPRIMSGELVGITTGLASVKDAFGQRIMVPQNDPRIKSGELVGITKGRIITDTEKKKISNTMKLRVAEGVVFGPEHKKKLSKASLGKFKTLEHRKNLSLSFIKNKTNVGKNHPRFKYYYHTPWGVFDSPAALEPEFTMSRMKNFCINNHKKMQPNVYKNCLKLHSIFDISYVGKTYKELGFFTTPGFST